MQSKARNASHDDSIFGAVYMNEAARVATLSNERPVYPVGAVIVREKLLTETSTSPEILAAMIKRKKGFNPTANDWEFLVVNGNATKVQKREKTGSCQQCHSSEKDKDFVFRAYVQ